MSYTPYIDIDKFKVGSGKTFIIAEIGSNHNQSLQLAYETIDAAVESGADAVKFQSLLVEELYYSPSEEIVSLHKKIDLLESWHLLLKEYCDKKKILFFSSPTYLKSVDLLESLDVKLYKLASAQIGTFPQIVDKVAKTGKPTILSTGIVSYSELEKVVNIFKRAGNNQYIILHCNSLYPTPNNRVNMQLMHIYKEMFGNPVGFSDHTDNIYVSIGAVARGASVIERHFAMSRSLPVPDAQYSLEPNEFKSMVDGIRAVEQSIGTDYRTEIQPEEKAFKNKILYRLVMNKDKRGGEILSLTDFDFKRHTTGIDCRQANLLINQAVLNQDVKKGQLLEWSNIIL